MLGKKLRTEDDRIKAAAKARKKKRKKMIKTKYGQKASVLYGSRVAGSDPEF